MFSILLDFFQKKRIDCFGMLPIHACKLKKPYLLERSGIENGSVIIMAIPYLTPVCRTPERNLSAYAVAQDYHLYFQQLFDTLFPLLQELYPQNKFVGFADHSPIDEIHAAARSGLGIIGKNRLLLTEKYSSYVFLGEIFTDYILPYTLHEVRTCEDCGACVAACPAKDGALCLSALTQKKGALTADEESQILRGGSVWGCDRCQEACPHTARALRAGSIFSPISFFSEQCIPTLTSNVLEGMDEEALRRRAYAWRGRETIARNLNLFEKGEPSC